MNQQGQATLEYILLTVVLVSVFVMSQRFLRESTIASSLTSPLKTTFKSTYQYGKPNVKGAGDRGGPEDHPREVQPLNKNFRIFIYRNPQ